MIHIGIDVGVSGAVGAVDGTTGRCVGVYDLPLIEVGVWKFTDGPGLLAILRELRGTADARVYMEYAGGMGGPKFGKTAIASLNRVAGSAFSAVMLAGLPIELIAPASWKRALGLTKKANENIDMKAKALALARMKFPSAADDLTRAKDQNRAEAILQAEFGRMRWASDAGLRAAAAAGAAPF